VRALVAAALDLPEDATEAGPLLDRLAAPPTGRPTVAVLAGGDAGSEPAGLVLASVSGSDSGVGHLDLLAVHPEARRRGVGSALVRRAEEELRALGVREVRWAGNPPCYGWPGVDVRYTPALCLAGTLGYERYRTAENLTADLATAPLDTAEDEARLAAEGVTVRRATADDLSVLAAWAERTWNASWAWELSQAVLVPGGGCHIALREQDSGPGGEPAVLAFAAYGGNRPSWFGPMGTDPAARKLGLGRLLLRRCLADQRASGLVSAQIGWVGPIPFYARAVAARVERIFWLYRRTLD
jgi:ribosomal protein S18 acetylase RimI-like enzyme